MTMIILIIIASVFVEIFGCTFFHFYTDIGGDEAFVIDIFTAWWIWPFILIYAIIKKPTLWLVKVLS